MTIRKLGLSIYCNIDNYTFYHNLIESIESNNYIRELANKIYNQFKEYLVNLLNKDQMEEIKDINSNKYPLTQIKNNKIFTYNGINTLVLPINNIFNKNIDLTIILEKKSNNLKDYSYYDDETKKLVIYVPNYDENYISLGNIKYILQIPDIIIHELIHFIDDIRSNGKYNIINKKINYSNDPAEIHAFTQQLLNFIYRNYLSGNYNNSHIEKLLQGNYFDGFIDYVLSNTDSYNSTFINNTALKILKDFYNSLTYENKRKVKKNLIQHIKSLSKHENYENKLRIILLG